VITPSEVEELLKMGYTGEIIIAQMMRVGVFRATFIESAPMKVL
jgi:hypothetical protein